MWQKMHKWERKFYWLDGGGGDGESVGFEDMTPITINPFSSVVPGEQPSVDPVGPAPDPAPDSPANGGGGDGIWDGVVAKEIVSEVGRQEEKQEEKQEKERKTRRRRPTLLTQQEGLLTSRGIRRSLIGGR